MGEPDGKDGEKAAVKMGKAEGKGGGKAGMSGRASARASAKSGPKSHSQTPAGRARPKSVRSGKGGKSMRGAKRATATDHSTSADANVAAPAISFSLNNILRSRIATVLNAIGWITFVISWAYSKGDQVLVWLDLIAWILTTGTQGLAWIASQPYRGYRISRTSPLLLYVSYSLLVFFAFVSTAVSAFLYLRSHPDSLLNSHLEKDLLSFNASYQYVHSIQQWPGTSCCLHNSVLTGDFACPARSSFPIPNKPGCKGYPAADALPYSCCSPTSPNCSQCAIVPDYNSGTYAFVDWSQGNCIEVISEWMRDSMVYLLVLAVIVLPLNCVQLGLFRVTETALRLAYRLNNPMGITVGWLRPWVKPAGLMMAVKEARRRIGAKWTVLESELEGSVITTARGLRNNLGMVEKRRAYRESGQWNARWMEELRYCVDECDTDYELERELFTRRKGGKRMDNTVRSDKSQ